MEAEGRARSTMKATGSLVYDPRITNRDRYSYLLYKDAQTLNPIKESRHHQGQQPLYRDHRIHIQRYLKSSVCNLASISLPKFVTADKKFDHKN